MLRRVLAMGCSLALFGVVSVASAADSPTTQPTTRESRPGGRGGFGGGFGMMRRGGAFGGGGMARNGPGPQGEDNQPGPGPRGGFFGRGGFGPGGGGAGGNGPARPGFGGGFGGGGAASNPPGRNLPSTHPLLARLDALLMAMHREIVQEEGGQAGPVTATRRGPEQGAIGRFPGAPGRFFEEMRRTRMARQMEAFRRDRGYGERDGRRFERPRMFDRESFARRRGPFRGEFRPPLGRMGDRRGMQRPGFRDGPPPRGFSGRGWFERTDGYRGGYGRFGPPEERRPMMDRYDRFGPPAPRERFGHEGGPWMGGQSPEQEEGFRPRRADDGRFDGRGAGPRDYAPRGRFDDPRGGPDDDQAPPPPRGRYLPSRDDRDGDR